MEQDNGPRVLRPGRIQPAPERREFLRRTLVLGGATVATAATVRAGAQDLSRNLPPNVPEWQTTLGAPILEHPYGLPSRYEANVKRRESPGLTRTPQSSVSFTPLQNLFGIITPSSLHFERHHGGMPEVDPHQHRLMIHGMLANPRIFTVEDVMRFPSVSRIHFIECGANTGMEWGNVAVPTVQYTHGMIACSEWTGVLLSTLLDECGYDRQRARFVLAEGADAASLTRSVPIEMALDDTMVVYAQNGEMLRPEQGYPLRLVVPGVQGVSSVKPDHHRVHRQRAPDDVAGRLRALARQRRPSAGGAGPQPLQRQHAVLDRDLRAGQGDGRHAHGVLPRRAPGGDP